MRQLARLGSSSHIRGMDMQTGERGRELIEGSKAFARTPGWLARLVSPGFSHILDRIDAGLEHGTIHGTLPDGSHVTLGGRGAGFEAEVTLHDWRALLRLATNGSIGWYQAWEAREWESPDPVPLFALFMANGDALGDIGRARGPFRWMAKLAHWLNRNTFQGAQKNITAHYDLGNDFYEPWLDRTMSYSSAIAVRDDGLEAAQRRKWAALAARLGEPASILEIGCGWGSLAADFAARGCDVTAISLSDEQLSWASAHHSDAIHFLKQDYRNTSGRFDAIVSVEMVEALGRENWPTFMDCIARNLKPGGRAAIQYISMKDSLFDAYARSADFIQAYIFPGGLLIRTSEFRRLAEERGLAWLDQVDFGGDYAETLRLWRANFDHAIEKGKLPAGFDQQFCNLWRYYLMYCEGGFRGGGIDVHQVTLEKGN